MPIYKGGIPSTTWANKPSATSMAPGSQVFISDVGIYGSMWASNGSKLWHDGAITLQSNGAGYLLPSLAAANAATYSQTGATITVTSTGHAIPNTTHNGKYVYLAIASGLATAGWYSNFQYVDANTFTCISDTSQSTSGTVNTNIAETTISAATLTLPGGLMGPNGVLQVNPHTTSLASANAKSLIWRVGASNPLNFTTGSTTIDTEVIKRLRNRNSEAKQIYRATNLSSDSGNASNTTSYPTVDTSADVTVTFGLRLVAANEFIALEHITTVVMPA